MADPFWLLNRNSRWRNWCKQRKNPGRKLAKNPAKLDETMALWSSKTTYFHSRVETSGEITQRWWTVGDDRCRKGGRVRVHEHLFTKQMPIQIQAKQTPRLLLRTITETLKLKNRRSCVPPDHLLYTRPGKQAISSDCLITISIPYLVRGGGGCHRKGGGRFSGPNDKPDTDCQMYLTISYTNLGLQNNTYFVMDAMNNPQNIQVLGSSRDGILFKWQKKTFRSTQFQLF